MITLNAGFSRKVGEANYGSRGANVNLELESGAIQDAGALHEKIRALFALARRAVDEELRNGNTTKQGADDPTPKEQKKPKGPVCSECGTGRMSDKVVKYSTEKFGKALCYKCQRKSGNKEGRET